MATLKSTTINDTGQIKIPVGTSTEQQPGDVVEVFTQVGTTTWTAPAGVNDIELLVVGGGGAGRQRHGGGGGGGGVWYYGPESPNAGSSYPVQAGSSYTVVVGAGGVGPAANGSPQISPYSPASGTPGGSSQFHNVVAGGGVGNQGTDGGNAGTGMTGTGFPRGAGTGGTTARGYAGGGGGGAGTAGVAVPYFSTADRGQGGHGGQGLKYSITGKAQYYAGGGGGSSAGTPKGEGGMGGWGGGGRGGGGANGFTESVAGGADYGEDGKPNTGGGAGGGSFDDGSYNARGGNGGTGIVVVRYANPQGLTAAEGQIRQVGSNIQSFDGTGWDNIQGRVEATGGDIVDVVEEGGVVYSIHTFLNSGTLAVSNGSTKTAEILLVGGGGGAGAASGNCSQGGGGAGGLYYDAQFSISPGSYPIQVGAGAAGRPAGTAAQGVNGGNTTAFNLTALGGGGGGGGSAVAAGAGTAGGSGGGGSHPFTGSIASALQPKSLSGGYGNPGAAANNSAPDWGGGGGGGAGRAGTAGTNTEGGDGGDGRAYSISGSLKFYAGGGAGATCSNGAADYSGHGGKGGGGSTGNTWKGQPGSNGLGGGGGGGAWGPSSRDGGDGGNGVAIIRYPIGIKPNLD